MSTDIVKATAGVELTVTADLSTDIIKSWINPVIIELAKTGIAIVSVAVKAYELGKVYIAYYEQYGTIMREDVVPVLALTAAHQSGRQTIKRLNLDADLEADALFDLNMARQHRRGQL
jgi:hypothetical protein